MARLVNLTGRPLRLFDAHGEAVDVPADARHLGVVAVGDHGAAGDAAGHVFSLNVRTVTEVKGMPEPEAGTLCVVPVEVAMVLQASRADVVFAADETVLGPDGRGRAVTHLRRVVSRL